MEARESLVSGVPRDSLAFMLASAKGSLSAYLRLSPAGSTLGRYLPDQVAISAVSWATKAVYPIALVTT